MKQVVCGSAGKSEMSPPTGQFHASTPISKSPSAICDCWSILVCGSLFALIQIFGHAFFFLWLVAGSSKNRVRMNLGRLLLRKKCVSLMLKHVTNSAGHLVLQSRLYLLGAHSG